MISLYTFFAHFSDFLFTARDKIKCQWIHYEIVNLITRRLAIVVIIAAISIGLLVQFMLWRIQDTGVDWIGAIMGLAAMGILVIAGLEFHYKLCHVPDEKR